MYVIHLDTYAHYDCGTSVLHVYTDSDGRMGYCKTSQHLCTVIVEPMFVNQTGWPIEWSVHLTLWEIGESEPHGLKPWLSQTNDLPN